MICVGDWVQIINRESFIKIYEDVCPSINTFKDLLQYAGKVGRVTSTDWHYEAEEYIYRLTCDDECYWWFERDLIRLPTKQTFI